MDSILDFNDLFNMDCLSAPPLELDMQPPIDCAMLDTTNYKINDPDLGGAEKDVWLTPSTVNIRLQTPAPPAHPTVERLEQAVKDLQHGINRIDATLVVLHQCIVRVEENVRKVTNEEKETGEKIHYVANDMKSLLDAFHKFFESVENTYFE